MRKTIGKLVFFAVLVCIGFGSAESTQIPLGTADDGALYLNSSKFNLAFAGPDVRRAEGRAEILPLSATVPFSEPPSEYMGKVVIMLREARPEPAKNLPGLPSAFALALAGFLCTSLMWQHKKWVAAVLAVFSIFSAGLGAVPRLLKAEAAAATLNRPTPARSGLRLRADARSRAARDAVRERAQLRSFKALRIAEPNVEQYAAVADISGGIDSSKRCFRLSIPRTPLPVVTILAFALFARPPPIAA